MGFAGALNTKGKGMLLGGSCVAEVELSGPEVLGGVGDDVYRMLCWNCHLSRDVQGLGQKQAFRVHCFHTLQSDPALGMNSLIDGWRTCDWLNLDSSARCPLLSPLG
ncbi:hypothetical protein IMZ48_17645 [Candidatus Bathyarchaeota archaeon]|nr:hypothetical protein [Candidatus Bathyarchaeota archaeon]